MKPFVDFNYFGNPKTLNCDRDSQGNVYYADMSLSVVRPKCLENLEDGLLPQNGWKKIAPIFSWGGCDVDFKWQIPMVEYWLLKNGLKNENRKNSYNKNKSFLSIKQSKSSKLSDNIYAKLKKCLNDKKLISQINQSHLPIIERLKDDLFSEDSENKQIKFKITENNLKEIELLEYENLLKFLVHRYRYDIYPQTLESDDYPPYLQIEPTSFCNYRCVFCFQSNPNFSKRKNGFMGHMTYETFKDIIDQAENNIEFISLASRGEPLICRDIEKMLAYTRNKFLNLKINTNASVLTESKIHSILQSGVKTLVFSADAANEKLYEKLRVNGSFKK